MQNSVTASIIVKNIVSSIIRIMSSVKVSCVKTNVNECRFVI